MCGVKGNLLLLSSVSKHEDMWKEMQSSECSAWRLKSSGIWHSKLVNTSWHFQETCCLHLQVLKQSKKTIWTLIMEAASYSKVQVIIIQQGIPIPEDLNLQFCMSVLKHNWNIKNGLNSVFSVNCIHCTKGQASTRSTALCRKVLLVYFSVMYFHAVSIPDWKVMFKFELHKCGILE